MRRATSRTGVLRRTTAAGVMRAPTVTGDRPSSDHLDRAATDGSSVAATGAAREGDAVHPVPRRRLPRATLFEKAIMMNSLGSSLVETRQGTGERYPNERWLVRPGDRNLSEVAS
jgi:hypothetical protein